MSHFLHEIPIEFVVEGSNGFSVSLFWMNIAHSYYVMTLSTKQKRTASVAGRLTHI